MRLLNFILRLVVGGAFVFAAAVKILGPAAFAADIGNYRLLPHEMINSVAIFLPWVELVAGLLLVLGFWRRANALIIVVLCGVFFIAISQALGRGLDIRCGCFGTIGAGQIGLRNLLIDGALLVMSGWLVWKAKE